VKPAAVPKAVPAAKMRAVKSATLGPAQAAGAEHAAMKTATTEPAATEAATMEAAAEAAAVTTAATAPRLSCNWLGECQNARERGGGEAHTPRNADRFHPDLLLDDGRQTGGC